nr:MAG TPA: Pyocin activator protein PrtN [Caudoviricetes sp.]
MEPISVTLDKACELTNIGKASMVKLMQDPKFPVFKIGNKSIIPVAGLRNYIEALAARHEGVI